MKRRRFKRKLGERRYRKLFILAVEGLKTEPQYFALFNNHNSVIRINCLKGKHDSSPLQVLKRMEDHLKREGLKKSDEAWLIIDRDQWTHGQLKLLYEWAQKEDNYGFALSNPKFEFWLLLHFEDGNNITNSRICSERLERYLPGYNKEVNARKITSSAISGAVSRAKQRDNPPCSDWPRTTGTTVYRLVEKLLS